MIQRVVEASTKGEMGEGRGKDGGEGSVEAIGEGDVGLGGGDACRRGEDDAVRGNSGHVLSFW